MLDRGRALLENCKFLKTHFPFMMSKSVLLEGMATTDKGMSPSIAEGKRLVPFRQIYAKGCEDHRNNLKEMKLPALRIQETLKSTNADDVTKAMQEYTDMIDRFYRANEHLMALHQCIAAKQDFAYFLCLLDLAIHYSLTNRKG
jgi:hypothetical protein